MFSDFIGTEFSVGAVRMGAYFWWGGLRGWILRPVGKEDEISTFRFWNQWLGMVTVRSTCAGLVSTRRSQTGWWWDSLIEKMPRNFEDSMICSG